ncbi:polysaccharide biosynthesis tyrosine autokinase, partial [bacterium]
LDREREHSEKVYGLLRQRTQEADFARQSTPNVTNVRLVDAATEPRVPIRPRVATTVAMGVVLGLLAGMAVAWLRSQLDNTLKTPQDVERELNVTFLGLLPQVDSDAKGKSRRNRRNVASRKLPQELAAHEDAKSGIAEAARSLRTNIMFRDPDNPYRKLLVTSAAPGEGKTTVALSLAVALAQGGLRVCVVDCDLRRPRLHRIFGRLGDMGVTNVLLGETTIDEVAKPTIVDNLWSIPSGPTPPNAADVLHSERFKRFIDELATRFDRVILDSPPIVAVTDAAIVAKATDGVVFVSRAHKSSRHLSKQGLRLLRDVDATIIGVVLNAVDLNSFEYN